MAELLRTNDPVLISVVEGLLTEDAIPYQVTDRSMSVLEGSINAFQIRILVPDQYLDVARQIVIDAELGEWLRA